MLTILWLHKHGVPARDVYGGDSIAFAMLRVGDVFAFKGSDPEDTTHNAHYIVSAQNIEIRGSRVTSVLQCNECVPPDEVAR